MAGRLQPRRAVDEKDRIVDVMFLTQFSEKHRGGRRCSRRIEPHVQQAVGVGIDSSVQPISLVIELDHGLINRHVIRVGTVCGL